ncbi:MAG: WYL domain-containing protein [Planctomycetes bacterium]|nr:WYL domain-containing protein [Planctomycetota bacterium]
MTPLRLARLLRLIAMLQSGRGYNALQLARECEVSRRTIFRDLQLLNEAAIPVRFDLPRQTYRIAPEYTAPVPHLSADEVTALLLSARFSPLSSHEPLRTQSQQAIAKLLAGSPPRLRQEGGNLLEACVLGSNESMRPPCQWEVFVAIAEAIRYGREVRVTYAGEENDEADPPHRTKFAPYRLIASAGRWSVVGRSSAHRAIRSFPLEQIVRVEKTDHAISCPPRFRTPHNGVV